MLKKLYLAGSNSRHTVCMHFNQKFLLQLDEVHTDHKDWIFYSQRYHNETDAELQMHSD